MEGGQRFQYLHYYYEYPSQMLMFKQIRLIGIIILQLMRGIVYFILFCVLAVCSQSSLIAKYPDCLRQIPEPGQEVYQMEKYLTLYQKMYPLMSHYNFTSFSSTVIKNQYHIIFQLFIVVLSFVGFFIILCRVCFAYSQAMRVLTCPSTGAFANWGIIFLGFCSLLLYSGLSSNMDDIVKAEKEAECQARYIPELLVYGDNSSDWAGFDGFQRVIQIHARYFRIISNMPQSYAFFIPPVVRRIGHRGRFAFQFQKSYAGATIQYFDSTMGMQKVTFKTLFPELFNPEDFSWKKQIDKVNQKFLKMSEFVVKIEQLTDQIKVSGLDAADSLEKKLASYGMSKNFLLQAQNWISKWDYYRKGSDEALVVINFFLSLGLVNSFIYGMLVTIMWRYKHRLLLKLTKYLWAFLIVELVGCVIIYYIYSGPATTLSSHCKTYSYLLKTPKAYYSYINITTPKQNNSQENPPTYHNLHVQLYPCLYGKGDFTNIIDYRDDSRILTQFMITLQNYLDYLDPTTSIFIDLYSYSALYKRLIKEVKARKFLNSGDRAWPYLNTKLQKLNNETLYNSGHTGCYKHKWVFHINQCPPDSHILNSNNTNQLLVPEDGYFQVKTQCLVLFNQDVVGDLQALAYNQFIRNYLTNTNDSRCNSTVVRIMNISLDLFGAIQTKFNSVQSLVEDLTRQKKELDVHMRLVRTNHLQKKGFHQYILRNANTTPISTESYRNYTYAVKNHTNCTCIKRWLRSLHRSLCLTMRSKLSFSVYYLYMLGISLFGMIVLGFMNGFNEELQEINDLYYTELRSEFDQEISFRKGRRIGTSRKYR